MCPQGEGGPSSPQAASIFVGHVGVLTMQTKKAGESSEMSPVLIFLSPKNVITHVSGR